MLLYSFLISQGLTVKERKNIMKLLTKEICKEIPALYANEDKKPEDVKIAVKFFCPWGSWSWFATEACGLKNGEWKSLQEVDWALCEDVKFFGFVAGDFPELGYFLLSELLSVTGPMGLHIERDMYFGSKTLAQVMEKAHA